MERFILIPPLETTSHPLTPGQAIFDQRSFGQSVVDRVRGKFTRDVSFSISDAAKTTPTRSDHLGAEGPNHEVKITAFPASNLLLIDGPPGLGSILQQRKHLRGEQVLRVPDLIVSARSPLKEATHEAPPGFWHLGTKERKDSVNGTGDQPHVWLGCVDTGIFRDHREFANRTVKYAEISKDGLNIDVTAKPTDPDGHGTHIMAVAAGNHCGIAPRASIAVAACPLNTRTATLKELVAQVAAGVEFLLNIDRGDGLAGVDVINLSLGVPGFRRLFSPIVKSFRSARRVAVVAAIGNRGPDTHDSPADHTGVHGVGAFDSAGELWAQTSTAVFGRKRKKSVPIYLAPGVGVWSAYTTSANAYVPLSGTSVASAVAAGAACSGIHALRANGAAFLASDWTFKTERYKCARGVFYKILY